ncbi:MAG: acetate--CoA ligase family protein, partial [Chloroflexota bacterium]|nr:acetate--CoA ligase family protein [Chloroflexota bacterium]
PAAALPDAPHPAAAARGVVAGAAARRLLSGIEHVESVVVTSREQAAELAGRWGRSFLKVESEAHPHKTELALVEGPLDRASAGAAYARLAERRSAIDAAAPIVMQPAVGGVELALGAYHDPTFGPAVMVATGGIFLEIVRDARFALAPLDEEAALRLIRSLRGAPLLLGARGRPRADVRAAACALAALSRFIADADGAYSSVDVNPLMVREEGKGAVAVDAIAFPAEA